MEQQDFHFAAGGLMAQEASGDDFGVVADEDVAWLEEGGEIIEVVMRGCASRAVELEEATMVARFCRVLADEFGWEVVGEVVRFEHLEC